MSPRRRRWRCPCLGMTLLAASPGMVTGQTRRARACSTATATRPRGRLGTTFTRSGPTTSAGTSWARLAHGARASLTVGYAGLAPWRGLGVALGLLGRLPGRRAGPRAVGVIDAYLSFPYILIAIVWAALIRMTALTLVLIIALRGWVEFARVVRAQVLSIREREFVVAARALGGDRRRLMARHVLPSIAGTILVIAGFQLGRLILLESTLSFLGLGIQPPTPAWGAMLADARLYLTQAWWTVAFPSLAISVVVLAANFLGDSLRDHLDPTIRGRL